MKRPLVLAACVLAGVAAGGIWTVLQSDRFRADSRLVVKPANPAVEALAESSLIESNVAQTLHLSSPPDISAKAGSGGVITVSAEAGDRERARQIDAEAVVIFTQRVPQRFPGATATVLDPAHVAEQTSPTPTRNFLAAGLVGLAGGLAAAAALRRPRGGPITAADPESEHRLQTRIDEVAKRERALGRRAGELVKREREVAEREAAAAAAPAQPEPERETPAPVPEEPPVPEPAPVPRGGWNLHELQRFVDTQANASPEQLEEWRTYLFFLREHADADGSLPRSFDGLLTDVFTGAA